MDEIKSFVKHYRENDGHIRDPKYLDGHQIKAVWQEIIYALDEYRRIQSSV